MTESAASSLFCLYANERANEWAVSGSQSSLARVGDPKEEWTARRSAVSSGGFGWVSCENLHLLASESPTRRPGKLVYNRRPFPSASVLRFFLYFPQAFP